MEPSDAISSERATTKSGLHPLVYLVALISLGAHLAVAGRYGFHRDEFYYLVGGRHLALGFVDHPPLVPAVAALAEALFGPSLVGLRLFAALACATVIVLVGLLTRQFGGGRWAQTGAALLAALAPLYVAVGSMFQTVVFDQVAWLLAALALGRALERKTWRAWLLVGVAFGVGLWTKYTILLWGFGLALGLLTIPRGRRALQTPGPWLAAVVALVLWLPNLLWQIRYDGPTLAFMAANNANVREDWSLLGFLGDQVLLMGVPGIALALVGLVRAVRDDRRLFAVAFLVGLGVLLLTQGKTYYLGPAYLPLLAAGACAVEERLRSARSRRIVVAVAVLLSLPPLPLVLPVLPVDTMVRYRLHAINEDLAEQLGWPDLVATVTRVYEDLSPDEQARAVILTGNYGQAGALEVLGHNLPPVLSGHNSYHSWGPPERRPGEVVIVVGGGIAEDDLPGYCGQVTRAATLTNPWNVPNEENRKPVFVCRAPTVPLADIWPLLRHFD